MKGTQVSRRARTHFVLFLCRSRLVHIDGFHYSLTPAEYAVCCSADPMLTIRV